TRSEPQRRRSLHALSQAGRGAVSPRGEGRRVLRGLAQAWPACHQYTHLQSGSQWSVGQISNANGTLSTIATEQNASAPGWACGRALALKNNVIIDINTCSADPADSAVKIANQIAANVAARW